MNAALVLRAAALALACTATVAAGADAAADAAALRARHGTLAGALAASPFGRPLVLESQASTSTPRGEVHAVLPFAFRTVRDEFQRADAWCDVLTLQFNVKRCVPSEGDAGRELHVAIGRKRDDPVSSAHRIEFRFMVRAQQADFLAIDLRADAGPLDTTDYRLSFAAVPLDAQRTFVQLSYSYTAGLAARLATEAYLATSGRDKVGFSAIGAEHGSTRRVGGMRGVAERNTMRYFLAVEACLDVLAAASADRFETRLHRWFAATERHPRQLHEMDLEAYLAMKRRERAASSRPAPAADPGRLR